MLIDLNDFNELKQDIVLLITTQIIQDYEPVNSIAEKPIKAIISIPKPDELQNLDKIKADREYIKIYTDELIKLDDMFRYNGKTFKVIQIKDYSMYGYIYALGEKID